jgi:F0F1-type ATP synthase membrane subunit b/b'
MGMLETDSTAQSEGIYEVLQGLDRATKEFTRRLDELAAVDATLPRPPVEHAVSPPVDEAAWPTAAPVRTPVSGDAEAPIRAEAAAQETAPPDVGPYPSLGLARAHLELDRRMADAEAEAHRYLEEAKQRADSMVQSIVNAVEAEADAMRRDAEEGIRTRWVEVEAEAERFLADARRAADGIVENRQRRIAELSDTIVGLAGELTERMSDAAEMQRRFDALVGSLSEAAERIATDPASGGSKTAAEERRGSWRARVEAAEAAEAQGL